MITDAITQENYVEARVALIPDAQRAANEETGERVIGQDGNSPSTTWTRSFLRHMDRLCVEHGVVIRKD